MCGQFRTPKLYLNTAKYIYTFCAHIPIFCQSTLPLRKLKLKPISLAILGKSFGPLDIIPVIVSNIHTAVNYKIPITDSFILST